MSKVLFLIYNPAAAWERMIKTQRDLRFIWMAYLLPMILLASIGEGLGVAQWRKWYVVNHGMMHFTWGQVVVFEAMRAMVAVAMVVICTFIIWMLREPFYSRYRYGQVVTVVVYSLTPLFLCWLLSGIPWLNLWIPWVFAAFLSLRILYYGMPRVLESDPGHAAGLFFVSCVVILGLTGAERYMFIQCLTGRGVAINNVIFDVASKLPF